MRVFQYSLTGLLLAACMLASGCRSNDSGDTLYAARFYLETSPKLPASWVQTLTMPVSETEIHVSMQPVITEIDIINVELVQLDFGKALMFELNRAGGVELYQATVASIGKRLVLTINGIPVGVRQIDRPISDATLITFTELDDAALDEMIANLRETTVLLSSRH